MSDAMLLDVPMTVAFHIFRIFTIKRVITRRFDLGFLKSSFFVYCDKEILRPFSIFALIALGMIFSFRFGKPFLVLVFAMIIFLELR